HPCEEPFPAPPERPLRSVIRAGDVSIERDAQVDDDDTYPRSLLRDRLRLYPGQRHAQPIAGLRRYLPLVRAQILRWQRPPVPADQPVHERQHQQARVLEAETLMAGRRRRALRDERHRVPCILRTGGRETLGIEQVALVEDAGIVVVQMERQIDGPPRRNAVPAAPERTPRAPERAPAERHSPT